MLILNTDIGRLGRIGLRVPKRARTVSHRTGISPEKPAQELAPTLHRPMVEMTVQDAKMTLTFATTMYLVVSSPLVDYFVKFSRILGRKSLFCKNTDILVKLQPEIALGSIGESGHHALRLVEMDQEDELGLKQNKK